MPERAGHDAKADECVAQARQARDPEIRRQYQELTAQWQELAQRAQMFIRQETLPQLEG
jgi:hypothetical protein